MPEHVLGLCGVCSSGCGVELELEGGRIARLKPLKGHPLGIVCPRGTRAAEIVYSPDRLLYPQRRIGERGEGRFERISWDDAFELMTERLTTIAAEYGPEALSIYSGRGNFEFGLNEQFAPTGTSESSANAVLFPLGSPNAAGVGSLCFVSYGLIAPRACFGAPFRELSEDLDDADLIFVWGANPATASPAINLPRLKAAQARGGRVVVIDHRRSETARALRAEWVGVRPGSDGALALGMLKVVIEEQLYDREFVEQWTHGFDELRAYLEAFTPEEVERLTWVPAEKVPELARAIAAAQGFSMLMYTGLEYSNSGVQAIRAAMILQAITGNVDTPGGKLFRPPNRTRLNRLLTEPPASPLPIGAKEFPLFYEVRREAHAALLPRAILEGEPYPIRSMIVSGGSIITAWPNPGRWRQALAALDFLAVIDRFPTADAAYADLLLPATSMFEIESYMEYEGHVGLRRRVIEPVGEARNDYLIFAELAARLGYGDRWPQTEEAMIDYALAGTGVTADELRARPDGVLPLEEPPKRYRKYASGELRADGKPGFETPTGKFEIASEWFREHGYEPLPVYSEPSEGPLASPELTERYPLVFNSGARIHADFRTQHHNIPGLARLQPEPVVHLHADDAEARGIAEGDLVDLVSARGRVRFRAHVSEDIVRGAVEANMGGGGPLGPRAWQRANVNELTDEGNYDPISGFPVFKALLCDVEPVVEALVAQA
ncbi:MAG TPA: molybdopterin-dependent oxidoreductase [Gaiellaceae bacterium]|jgi:anaerobic selenocysteine-containing dehydrogenase